MKKKVAIGGTYQMFIDWCRENDTSPATVIYAGNDREKVTGLELSASDVVRVGRTTPAMEREVSARIRK